MTDERPRPTRREELLTLYDLAATGLEALNTWGERLAAGLARGVAPLDQVTLARHDLLVQLTLMSARAKRGLREIRAEAEAELAEARR